MRLYFTSIVERNYYEWTTAVLGKTLEADYPVFEGNQAELETLMSEAPRLRAPYREVFFEYPPVLMFPILVARIPSETFWGFTRVLALVISLTYLACLWVAYRIWQRLPAERRLSWPTVLLLSLAGISALGQIYVTRLDVFPSLVVLLAIWTFLERRWLLSAVWVAVGVLTKGYAIVLAPVFGLVLLRQVRYRALAVATTTIVTILLLTNIWLGWITDGVYWQSFRFHAARGLQIESMYALVPYLGNLLFDVPINIYIEYKSVNIEMVNGGDWLLTASTILPVVGMMALCFMFWRGASGARRPQCDSFAAGPRRDTVRLLVHFDIQGTLTAVLDLAHTALVFDRPPAQQGLLCHLPRGDVADLNDLAEFLLAIGGGTSRWGADVASPERWIDYPIRMACKGFMAKRGGLGRSGRRNNRDARGVIHKACETWAR